MRRLVLVLDDEFIARIAHQGCVDRRPTKNEAFVLIEEALKVRERKQAQAQAWEQRLKT